MVDPNETFLDVKGLNCPMPLLKAKRTLNGMEAGERLRVVATDPGSMKDFTVFAKQAGHDLLEAYEDQGTFNYLLVKHPRA
ncbi:MAG: sulfurtransferase TusA family protein [Gammaproteobacteria bacterium]|nr:sulfurtransferase TusA family protein [Gammaproteobacteria bacterium]